MITSCVFLQCQLKCTFEDLVVANLGQNLSFLRQNFMKTSNIALVQFGLCHPQYRTPRICCEYICLLCMRFKFCFANMCLCTAQCMEPREAFGTVAVCLPQSYSFLNVRFYVSSFSPCGVTES